MDDRIKSYMETEYTIQKLQEYCSRIQPPDPAVLEASVDHWNHIAKPLDGLGLFEHMITKIAGIQNHEEVRLDKKAVIAFCADNGVVAEGVTQTDSSVTAIVTDNFARGIASVNRMAQVAGADVIPVDIGVSGVVTEKAVINCKVAYGTKNLAKEAAMTEQQTLQAIFSGIAVAHWMADQGYQILATGEMGIGNTTTSSALASVLLDLPVEQVTGKGAGLSAEGIVHKKEVIECAIRLHQPDPEKPLELLQKLGGFDIAGMVGLYLGGAIYRVPVVIDGLIASVAALLACKLNPVCRHYMLPSHMGKEPASQKIMEQLKLHPVIYGELALGEGTGAVMLFPLLDMALKVYQEYSTFENIHVEEYRDYGKMEQ